MTHSATIPGRYGSALRAFVPNCSALIQRNLLTASRVPQMVLAVVVQPLMFVLVFSYVLGDSLGGGAYRQFLIGGIMAQTVCFNAMFSALGMATDCERGVMDRFFALPMSRTSILVSRAASDVAINVIGLIVMSVAGLVIGWRIGTSFGIAVGAYLLAILFGLAMSWVGAIVGTVAGNIQATQSLLVTILFPVTFVSSAFVPSARLPGPLREVANWNPVTSLARSLREGFGNPTAVNAAIPEPWTWASHNPQLYTVLWSLAILAVCVPLSMLAFRSRVK